MLELDRALELVLQRVKQSPPEKVGLAKSLFRILAEDIVSDVNAPPHDKAMMDGYAVRAEDVQNPGSALEIIGTVTAGEIAKTTVGKNQAMRIMTGAPVPEGANAVVMREDTDDPPKDAKQVTINSVIESSTNIMRTATNIAVGDTVLKKGSRLRSIELGLLSEVGCLNVPIVGVASAGVLATGNELVPVDKVPSEGKIRNSNGPMLCAMARSSGCHAYNLGIARDTAEDLRMRLEKGLQAKFLIVSGGVSAGDLDLVPPVLKQFGVEEVFHKVRIKPGKPVWFGVGKEGTLVFGLPGNPVSSLVCFELLVRPAMMVASGLAFDGYEFGQAQLVNEPPKIGDRRTFWPARLVGTSSQPEVELLPWQGSSDLRALASADCLVDFAARATSAANASDTVSYVKLQ